MDLVEKIIEDVKKKKELSTISCEFVIKIVKKQLKGNPKLRDFFESHDEKTLSRSSKYKNFIKKIRSELRKVYGVYARENFEKRKEFLENGNYDKILESHLSTKERLPIYKELYKKIWEITGKPKSILDLACGMNPFSLKYMNLKNPYYWAVDISKEDAKLLNEFFKKEKIDGKAKVIDLLEIKEKNIFKGFPEFDVAFLFKFLDTAIIKSRKVAELLIKSIPAKWVVVSFSKRTIGQKEMKKANRDWILKLCKKLGYEVKVLNFPNEVFYVIKK
jgi:16S rRNA (guanine(1405)-N(7))-methyltransferase